MTEQTTQDAGQQRAFIPIPAREVNRAYNRNSLDELTTLIREHHEGNTATPEQIMNAGPCLESVPCAHTPTGIAICVIPNGVKHTIHVAYGPDDNILTAWVYAS